jgi:thiosulfate/3-mercaptopyruvate sulfurtransferase
MYEDYLVTTAWLEQHLSDPDIRIVDMRGYVKTVTQEDGQQTAEYVGAKEEYLESHIPGAVYLDWTKDIVDLNDPVPAQVAGPEKLAQVLGEAGISDRHTVIAYDSHPAMQFSTRLWWVFRYYGHSNVKVLNGGWNMWLAEKRITTAGLPTYPPTTFSPRLQPEWRATAEDVLGMLGETGIKLIDARDTGQYSGQIARGKRGGRIPGAISLPRDEFIDPNNGTFRSEEELRQVIDRLGIKPEERVVAYCNGGVAATTVLFTLSLLGYKSLTNYDGSWNEWTEREELPVEV